MIGSMKLATSLARLMMIQRTFVSDLSEKRRRRLEFGAPRQSERRIHDLITAWLRRQKVERAKKEEEEDEAEKK